MDLGKWLHIVEQVGGAVLPFTPAAPLAPFILGGIQIAEQIPGATGEQKKAFVQGIVALGAAATNTSAGHQVLDPQEAANSAGSAIDTVVGVSNLVHGK